jgi:hypothetical protein
MAIDQREAKAYDFAADLIKQLIGLGTGVLTLTLAFYDTFLETSSGPTAWMVLSWIVFVLSIVAGILALMALTGGLAGTAEPNIRSKGQQRFAQAQFILFVGALALMVVAVLASGTD